MICSYCGIHIDSLVKVKGPSGHTELLRLCVRHILEGWVVE